MPFNGSGTYSLPAGNPVTTGTTISSSTNNSTNSDIATALSTCIAKDGQTTLTANIPFGGFKLTGIGNGSASTDAVALGQLQAQTGVYVGTVGGTADVITLTASPAITAYAAGQTFSFIASGANTTNVTVNVSSLGAKALTKFGTTALVANNILSGSLVTIQYDGTQFQLMNVSLISSANNFTGLNTFSSGIGPAYLQNIGLTSAVSAKALTVALKTKALADASATDPAQIAFRNATLTTGDYVVRSATAATSVVVPSGATLGFTTAQTGYLYVYVLDNAGTIELAISASNGFNTAAVQSTTAISTSADSGSVLYSTSARTDIAIRYIGRIKIATGTVPGEWDNEDTEITLSDDFRGNSQGPTKVATATTNIWDGGDSCHIGGATVTMTIASPCVVTETGNIRADQDPIKFTTTGALPTGLVVGTQYYVKTPSGSTYNVSATAGGAAINTSGTQSGTHTVIGTITSFGTAQYAGQKKRILSDVAIPLTQAANLNLPTGASLVTAAGDSFTVYADTTTQFDIIDYNRATGLPLAGTLTSGTVVNTTSGGTAGFTGIPSTVKKISLLWEDGGYTSGIPYLQIGDSGGLETTGYNSNVVMLDSSGAAYSGVENITTQFNFLHTGSSNGLNFDAFIDLELVDSTTNTWICKSTVREGTVKIQTMIGSKSLTGTLDRITFTVGTGNYDAGKLQILYQ